MYKGRTAQQPPLGSATQELLASGRVGDIQSKGSVLSEWKPRIKSWRANNEILVEEAIHLGQHGVLTLLRNDINPKVSLSY